MELLAQHGELSVTAISRNFDMSQPAISQHLKILREAKLIDVTRAAQSRLYHINKVHMTQVEEWTHKISTVWNTRLHVLEKVLKIQSAKYAEKNKSYV